MMTASRTLLVRTAALSAVPGFVITCDDAVLRWLGKALRRLSGGKSFRLGDDRPVGSDGQCMLEIVPGSPETCSEIAPASARHFRWVLPAEQAARYADLIDAMEATSGACHQYLEGHRPDVPVVIVTKGEYDAAALRLMRDARR